MISGNLETILIEEEENGIRVDKLLAQRFPEFSRTYFQYLIDQSLVFIEGKAVKKRILVKKGDEIEIHFALTPEISLEPELIPLSILFEDEHLLAINKPAGLVVHPGAGNPSGTFVNALLYHCKQLIHGKNVRPGIVHRLDKDTSGVLLAAKTEKAQQCLVESFAHRKMRKEYLAICIGRPSVRLIEGKIGRHPLKRKEMTIVEAGGKPAKTFCEPLAENPFLTLVRLFPETGRTHQLRVHLKSIRTPILGDKIYGSLAANQKYQIERQFLHASKLQFLHPITGEEVILKAPLAEDMATFIKFHFGDYHF